MGNEFDSPEIFLDNPDCKCIGVCNCKDVDDGSDFENEAEIPTKIVKYIDGKRTIKRTCGDGYRYDPELKRCVKLTAMELRKQKLASKKRVKKMKMKMKQIMRKREKTMRIRDAREGN